MCVWNLSFFFLRKLLESCYLAEHLLERLHVQGGVVVLRAHWLNHLAQFSRHSRSHFPIALFTRAPSPPPLVPLPKTYSRRLQQLLHRDITGTLFLIEHAIFSTSNFELLRFEHRAFLSEERTYAATWNSVNSFKNKRIDYCYYYDRDRSLRFAKKYCPKEP